MGTHFTENPATYRPDIADLLQEFSVEADQMGFVGLRIAPAFEVAEVGGQYPVQKIEEALKDRSTLRNNDGSYNRGQGKVTKDTYLCEEHGLEERVDERRAAMYRNWYDSDMLAASRTRDAVLRNHEKRVVDASLAVPGGQETAASNGAWTRDNKATATPVDDVSAARVKLRNRTGVTRASLVVDWEVYLGLQQNAQVIENLKHWGGNDPKLDAVTQAVLAIALGVDELIVAGSMMNSAPEGQTGTPATLSPLWDRTKGLLFVPGTGADTLQPQYMRTFHWGADGSTIGSTFEEYFSNERRSRIMRNRMDTDEKKVYAAAAEVITGVAT